MVVYVVAFSLYFYYKSSAWFFMLLVITSVLDWCLSRIMSDTRKLWKRRLCLWLSIGMSLSILGFFKYANFFLWNWNQMVEGNFQPLDIILPVGISFYTFQSISYIVDVYKGRVSPTETWIEYLFFLSYFPALVAGPIVRADYFLPQIQNRDHASRQEMGRRPVAHNTGLVKKAVVADYIAQYNDLIFASPTGYSGLESLMGVVGYVVQIYCDFSGYSDMAIGISAIMGFRLTKNFDFPYKSRNLTDSRRWHISGCRHGCATMSIFRSAETAAERCAPMRQQLPDDARRRPVARRGMEVRHMGRYARRRPHCPQGPQAMAGQNSRHLARQGGELTRQWSASASSSSSRRELEDAWLIIRKCYSAFRHRLSRALRQVRYVGLSSLR